MRLYLKLDYLRRYRSRLGGIAEGQGIERERWWGRRRPLLGWGVLVVKKRGKGLEVEPSRAKPGPSPNPTLQLDSLTYFLLTIETSLDCFS